MNNNLLLSWFVEMIKRFATKSPTFFKVWQMLLGLLIAFTGLPDFLQNVKALNITLPHWLEAVANAKLAFALLGAFVMSFQTTQSKPVITEEGNIVKATNAEKLPFTAVHEEKLAIKNETEK